MKKILYGIISIFISISYICNSGMSVYANSESIGNYFNSNEWKYYLTSDNFQYKHMALKTKTDWFEKYLLSISNLTIDTGVYPTKRDYQEALMNIIMTSELDTSKKVSEQYKFDNLKSAKDYAMDFKDMATSYFSIYTNINPNNKKWEKALSETIDGISMIADNTDSWVNAFSDLQTILYMYDKYDELTQYIYENSNGELKEAAKELNSGLTDLMCIRLDVFTEALTENIDNYSNYIFSDEFIVSAKSIEELDNNEFIKFLFDNAEKYLSFVAGEYVASWNLGKLIGKTIGNLVIGGENLIKRVIEIEALSDIEEVISKKVFEQQEELLSNQNIEDLENYVHDCELLIGIHIRGEYSFKSIIMNDAGLVSLLNNVFGNNKAEYLFEQTTERLVEISEKLSSLLEQFKEETTQNYEWYLEPTIQADNIIVPDDSEPCELFQNYAIIERNGKYGIISKDGEIKVECKYIGYSICYIDGTYIMATEIKNEYNEYISKSDDYSLKDNKLTQSKHGGHGFNKIKYLYDNKEKKSFSMNLGIEEYTGKDIYPAQEALHKDENGYYDTFGNWGLISGNKVIKDFEYSNGRYTNSLIALEKNGLWGYFDHNGKEIIPFIAKQTNYINVEEFISSIYQSDNMAFMDVNGIIAINTENSGCFYDIKGNKIINTNDFEEVRPMINGYAWVKVNGKWGVIKSDIKIEKVTVEEQSEELKNNYSEAIDNQSVSIVLQNYDMWSDILNSEFSNILESQIGFLDIDFDGELEFLATNIQDAGFYSHLKCFDIDINNQELIEIENNSNIDIIGEGLELYKDKNNCYFYLGKDEERISVDNIYYTTCSLKYENNKLVMMYLYADNIIEGTKKFYKFNDTKETEISSDEYEKIVNTFYEENDNLNLIYYLIRNFNDLDEEEKMKELLESYNHFTYDGFKN